MKLIGRILSSARSNFLITTPIFYANSSPHVGHLYSALLADAMTRWKLLKQEHGHVEFCTGTDEHGFKIEKKAKQENQACLDYCNQVSQKFRSLFDLADIKHTDFVRTTEPRHHLAVTTFWNDLMKKGFIYKSSYAGWYSVNDECFLTDDQIETKLDEQTGKTNKFSIESGHLVEYTAETNYMFKLADFKQEIRDYIATGCIIPQKYQEFLNSQIESLQDLSVSREASRVSWGIPVPNDNSQVIYVWLDALVNYLTTAGYPDNMTKFNKLWPADYHIVGKDILRFHAIYWPAFLIAANLKLPKQILCHGHWLMNGRKMSKSIGNVVDPFDAINKYTKDGLRYFLLREGVPDSDSNLSEVTCMQFVNQELSNTLGNLYQRCLKFNRSGEYPSFLSVKSLMRSEDLELIEKLDRIADECNEDFEAFNFYKGIPNIMSAVRLCNNLVQESKPWLLARSGTASDEAELMKLIFLVYETLRISGILLQPITPTLCNDLLTRLNIDEAERYFKDARVNRSVQLMARRVDLKSTVLFKRL